MFRRTVLLPVLLLAMLLMAGACGGKEQNAATTGADASSSPGACPTAATKKFAKTRFAADAGLAFGAFYQWIWKPYKAGTFQSGANGRTTAMVKAGAAGLFAANRLNAGRQLINADPTLCKALKEPVDKLWASMGALAAKFKKGEVDPTDIDSISSAIEGVKSDAGEKADTTIKDRTPPGF